MSSNINIRKQKPVEKVETGTQEDCSVFAQDDLLANNYNSNEVVDHTSGSMEIIHNPSGARFTMS